jgi:hypothetical protein
VTYIDPDKVRQLRPAPAKPPPPVAINAAALRSAVFKPVSWVVQDFIPDGLTMLAGKPKLGKSWLVLDVAVAVANGGYTLDRKCGQGDVLYAALEDNQRRLKSRMERVCQFGEWPSRLTFWTEMQRLEDGGLAQLEEWISSVERPRLIVIDVFTKVKRQKANQEGLYDADYLAASPLKSLADRVGVAIVVVHHLRKMASDDDPFDAVSGSTGLTGAMDTILILKRGSEGVTLYGRGRDVEEIESAVQFNKDSCRWSVLGDAREVHISKERRAIIEALRTEAEPLAPNVISVVTGHPAGATRRLLMSMARDGEVIKVGRGKYTLPDITPPRTSVTK